MELLHINIENFRNLKKLSAEFSPGVNIFFGNNGSGKTNLLEAIFLLCLGRSHRATQEQVLINNDSDYYRIEGLIKENSKQSELAVAFQKGSRKKVTLDKVTIKTSELYDNFCAVTAGPEDSNIISGSPSMRRNFIDVYLSQYSQKYLHHLSHYQKALAQKNAALKNEMDCQPFNLLLADTGSQIMMMRYEFIHAIKEIATLSYEKISGGDQFEMVYQPSIKCDNFDIALEELKELYIQTLNINKQREEIMTSSLYGPHRDELYFEINQSPAKTHGSQGEWRTAALSLKIAVHRLIREKRDINPLLLLDEIFAELDHDRSEALMEYFEGFEQLFLTTAVEPPDFIMKNSRSFKIDSGTIIG